jgi:hypothetical protein
MARPIGGSWPSAILHIYTREGASCPATIYAFDFSQVEAFDHNRIASLLPDFRYVSVTLTPLPELER